MWKSLKRSSKFMKDVFTNPQTGNPIFYKVKTYLDRLLVHGIYVIPNFVKVARAVLDIFEKCVRQTNRQPHILQGWDLSRSSSRAKNIYNTKFCENRLSGSRYLREMRSWTEWQRTLFFLQGWDLSRSSSRARNIS